MTTYNCISDEKCLIKNKELKIGWLVSVVVYILSSI